MNNVDPDILHVLKGIAASGESLRVATVKAKHERQAVDRMETQVELLADEVERVIPKNHPLFFQVLLFTVLRKAARKQEEQEPEYESALEGFFVGDQD